MYGLIRKGEFVGSFGTTSVLNRVKDAEGVDIGLDAEKTGILSALDKTTYPAHIPYIKLRPNFSFDAKSGVLVFVVSLAPDDDGIIKLIQAEAARYQHDLIGTSDPEQREVYRTNVQIATRHSAGEAIESGIMTGLIDMHEEEKRDPEDGGFFASLSTEQFIQYLTIYGLQMQMAGPRIEKYRKEAIRLMRAAETVEEKDRIFAERKAEAEKGMAKLKMMFGLQFLAKGLAKPKIVAELTAEAESQNMTLEQFAQAMTKPAS